VALFYPELQDYYYICFLAGLEIDLQDFKKNRQKKSGFRNVHFFLIPMFLGIVAVVTCSNDLISSIYLRVVCLPDPLIAYPLSQN